MGRWDLDDAREPERPYYRTPSYGRLSRDIDRAHGKPHVSDLRDRDWAKEPLTRSKDRDIYRHRGRDYQLNQAEAALMREVGCFRTIRADDLERHVYKNEGRALQTDIRHLAGNELVQIAKQPGRDHIQYVSLSPRGRQLTESLLRRNPEQQMYARAVKPRELDHDGRVYRMYEKEAERIRGRGGRPTRVVLDFELKRQVNRKLSTLYREPRELQEERKRDIAEEFGLRVVNHTLQIPDLRIEYEARDMAMGSVDLELVTGHYKRQQVSAKAAAGFTLYASGDDGKSKAMSEELMVEIFSI